MEGQLFRLARPDGTSRLLIRNGHGYLWVLLHPSVTVNHGAYFKSLVTGEEYFFHYDEMEKEG